MKKDMIKIGALVFALASLNATAQRIENDDMYFRAKDREKLKAAEAEYSIPATPRNKGTEAVTEKPAVNPTDSYSARNINPEYISRSNSEIASEQEQQYYSEGYSSSTNTYDSYSSSMYNPYSNNWNYGNNWYGYPGSSFNSPYYGYNPWMNPYGFNTTPGWSLSMSYFWGNSWTSGWGNPYYGYGNPYYFNPYYSSYYSPWGTPYYYGGGYEYSSVTYGKRPSRHSAIVTPTPRLTRTTTSSVATNQGSRTRQVTDEYYVKPSRRTSSFDNNSINRSTTRSSWNTYQRNSSSPNRDSRPSFTPSRSNSFDSRPRSAPSNSGSSSRPRSRN